VEFACGFIRIAALRSDSGLLYLLFGIVRLSGDFRPGAIGRLLAALARNRFVIGAVAAMAVSFFAFIALLSVSELSFAVPATAITYVLETALSRYVLKERVNWLRWAGASLVICGVALISL